MTLRLYPEAPGFIAKIYIVVYHSILSTIIISETLCEWCYEEVYEKNTNYNN